MSSNLTAPTILLFSTFVTDLFQDQLQTTTLRACKRSASRRFGSETRVPPDRRRGAPNAIGCLVTARVPPSFEWVHHSGNRVFPRVPSSGQTFFKSSAFADGRAKHFPISHQPLFTKSPPARLCLVNNFSATWTVFTVLLLANDATIRGCGAPKRPASSSLGRLVDQGIRGTQPSHRQSIPMPPPNACAESAMTAACKPF